MTDDSTEAETVEVKSGHRVTVPKRFRRRHDICEGDEIEIRPVEEESYRDVPEEELDVMRELIEEAY